MKRQNAGVWLGGFIFAFSLIIFIQSLSLDWYNEYGPGPGLLPLCLSGALMFLILLYIIGSIKNERITFEQILPKGEGAKKFLLILFSLIGFILIIPYAGFLITSTLFLCLLLIGAYKWYYNLMISLGTSLILFWIFGSFLNVPLPVNIWGF